MARPKNLWAKYPQHIDPECRFVTDGTHTYTNRGRLTTFLSRAVVVLLLALLAGNLVCAIWAGFMLTPLALIFVPINAAIALAAREVLPFAWDGRL